jgi:hypothetical protein
MEKAMWLKWRLFFIVTLLTSVWVPHEVSGQDQMVAQLEKAIEKSDSTTVKNMLKKGLDPNVKIEGWPGIVFAAKLDQMQIAGLFIAEGADVNARNVFGETALIIASYRENTELVRLLLVAGADPDVKGQRSRTALWYAADKGSAPIVKLLLNRGANVEAEDNKAGETPLLIASIKGHDATISLLIQHGANVNAANADCRSAVILAERAGNLSTGALLRAHGGKTKPFCFTKEQIVRSLRHALLAVFYLASVTALPSFLLSKAETSRQVRMRGWACLFIIAIGALGWVFQLGILERWGLLEPTELDDWVYWLALFTPLLVLFIIWTVLAFGLFAMLATRYLKRGALTKR